MNQRSYSSAAIAAYVVGILGTFLIMIFLVWVMRSYTRPAPLGTARADERRKALAEIRAADAEALHHYAWVDQPRGIVRLPIAVAMELTVREWRNPAAARSNLVARADQLAATAQPATAQGAAAPSSGGQATNSQPAAGQGTAPPAQGGAPGKTNEPTFRTSAPATPGGK